MSKSVLVWQIINFSGLPAEKAKQNRILRPNQNTFKFDLVKKLQKVALHLLLLGCTVQDHLRHGGGGQPT